MCGLGPCNSEFFSSSFLVDSLAFSLHGVLVKFSFLISVSLILCTYRNAVATTSGTRVNSSGDRGHFYYVGCGFFE